MSPRNHFRLGEWPGESDLREECSLKHRPGSSTLYVTTEQEVIMHNAMEWSSFIAGALLGAGAVLLFAPRSGTELRAMFCNYANRVKDDLREWDEEIYDMEEAVLGDTRRSAMNLCKEDRRQ